MSPVYPRDYNNKEDVKASEICKLFFTNSFLDPMVKGEFNRELVELLKKYNLLDEIYKNCVRASYTSSAIENIKIAREQIEI